MEKQFDERDKVRKELLDSKEMINSLDSNSNYVVSSSRDGYIYIYDSVNKDFITKIEIEKDINNYCLKLYKDFIIVGNDEGILKIIKIEKNNKFSISKTINFQLNTSSKEVRSLFLDENKKVLYVGLWDTVAKINLETFEIEKKYENLNGYVDGLACYQNKLFISCSLDNKLLYYKDDVFQNHFIESQKEIANMFVYKNKLIISFVEGFIKIMNMDDLTIEHTITQDSPINISNVNSNLLLTGNDENTSCIYRIDKDFKLETQINDAKNKISSICSTKGEICIGSYDGIVRVYRLNRNPIIDISCSVDKFNSEKILLSIVGRVYDLDEDNKVSYKIEVDDKLVKDWVKETPNEILVNDYFYYKFKDINKTFMEIKISAKDNFENYSYKTFTIDLFNFKDLKNVDNMFYYKVQNLSNKEITAQIELINAARNVVCSGVPKKFSQLLRYKTKTEFINFKNNLYYIRIRIKSDRGITYYPSEKGQIMSYIPNLDSYILSESTIDGDMRVDYSFLMSHTDKEYEPDKILDILTKTSNFLTEKNFNKESIEKSTVKKPYFIDRYGRVYGNDVSNKTINLFIKTGDAYISDNYEVQLFEAGKKTQDKINCDKSYGFNRILIKQNKIDNNKNLDLVSIKKHIQNNEGIIKVLTIENKEMEKQLTKGYSIKMKNQINLDDENLFIYIRYNNSTYYKRIDGKLYSISCNNKENTIHIKLNDYLLNHILNEIVIVSRNMINSIRYPLENNFNKKDYPQVPYYYLPIQTYRPDGQALPKTEWSIENVEVFVDGYRLYPYIDYYVINNVLHQQMPSMIVFKDIIPFGSNVEINILDEKPDTCYYFKQTDSNNTITLPDSSCIFVNQTFSIYSNHKRLNQNQYEIINCKTLILKDCSNKDIFIKFHYENIGTIEYLISRYLDDPNNRDKELFNSGIQECIDKYIKKNGKTNIIDKDDDVLKLIEDKDKIGKDFFIIFTADRFLNKELDVDFDCNNFSLVPFMTYLNPNTLFNLHYIQDNIEIDCNLPKDKNNFKNTI